MRLIAPAILDFRFWMVGQGTVALGELYSPQSKIQNGAAARAERQRLIRLRLLLR
jgi:hypothetical protein